MPEDMPEDARRQQIRKQLVMPDIRAVAVFQSHLEQGLWRSRHIQGLAADPKRELTADPMHTTKGIRHASDLLGYLDTGVCAAAVAPLDEPRPNPHPHPSPSP